MDNKALAAFVKAEMSKLETVIDKLAVRISSLSNNLWQQNKQTVTPEQTPKEHGPSTDKRVTGVSPSPENADDTETRCEPRFPRRTRRRRIWRWIKRIFLKRDKLEKIGILAGVAYAITTIVQWRDLRHNFETTERAYIAISKVMSDPENTAFTIFIQNSGHLPSEGFFIETRTELLLDNGSLADVGKNTVTHFGTDALSIPAGTVDFSIPINFPEKYAEFISVIEAGRASLKIWGDIYYGTGFDQVDHILYCYSFGVPRPNYPAPSKAVWKPCVIRMSDTNTLPVDIDAAFDAGAKRLIDHYKKQAKRYP